jgi:ABC-2 type transport system permease protein
MKEAMNKLKALSVKEGNDILRNRIYLLVVFVQVFILLGAFGLALASSVASDPALLDQYGASSVLTVGVPETVKGTPLETALIDQKLNITYYNNVTAAQNALGTNLVAVLKVDPNDPLNISVAADNSNIFYPVVSSKISGAVNQYSLEEKLRASGLNTSQIQQILAPVNLQIVVLNLDKQSKLALNSPYFVEIMYGFIVPFILLLPFFLASNIVTDSVVGERERKTFEVLLMTPVSSSQVMLGKIIPILSFSIIQSVLWILMLDLLKVPIYNPVSIIIVLFFVGLAFIGIGTLLSMFVDSTKEANSAITIVLVFATFILFMPLFIKTSYFSAILNFIPTVLIVKMASTPNIGLNMLIYSLPTVLISILIFMLTIRYFRHERAIRL